MTFHYRVEWTNWTFGIWWGRIGRKYIRFAVDCGPLQMRWEQ